MLLTKEEKDLAVQIEAALPKIDKTKVTRNLAMYFAETTWVGIHLLIEDYWDDKEIVLLAMKCRGTSFRFVSERLQNDIDVIRAAYRSAPSTFEEPEYEQQKKRVFHDRDLIIASMKESWHPFIAPEYSDDEELCKVALGVFPPLFKDFSERLRDNEAFVRIAAAARGDMISYASDRLRNDKEFILDLLTNRDKYSGDSQTTYCGLLKYLPKHLRDDEEIVAACVMEWSPDYMSASRRLRMNADFAITLMETLEVDLFYMLTPTVSKNEAVLAYWEVWKRKPPVPLKL